MLASFLLLFSSCFRSLAGRKLLRVYVQGLLSDVQRKNCEAIALEFATCPRALQRFLESIQWDEESLRDRCQEMVVSDHTHPEAIRLDPTNAAAYLSRGVAWGGKGDYDKAIIDLNEVIRLDPTNVSVRKFLNMALEEKGN